MKEKKYASDEDDENEERMHKSRPNVSNPKSIGNAPLYAILVVAIALLAFNQLALAGVGNSFEQVKISGAVTGGTTATSSLPQVIPKGTPAIYGAEIGVSYDDISSADSRRTETVINMLAAYDVNIQLETADLQRYIGIAGQISCEYCCGTDSVIFTTDAGQYKAGDAACGCAHSYAMRGVAKYLITQHGDEFDDNQILEEMGKWKTLFFPTQITQKAKILQDQGIELNYVNLASNKYRGIEQGSGSGGMVGGG